MDEEKIEAVLVDLDDTLFPQSAWLFGAWAAVTVRASAFGVDAVEMLNALLNTAEEGSDRGRIIDRALDSVGAEVPVEPLVDAFREYRAPELPCFPGVRDALDDLRPSVALAVVSDGDPKIQRGKIRALRLDSVFDAVVLSDEMGREFRKPRPEPLLRAAALVGVAVERCVYIGDRPSKDVLAAARAGMRAVRVRTGEYASDADVPEPWRSEAGFTDAVVAIKPYLPLKH